MLHDPCSLVKRLASFATETEWLEFKENNNNPVELGEYISAIANSTMLHDRSRGYLVFGVRDTDHQLVGTTVNLNIQKHKNEELKSFIERNLNPQIRFEFESADCDGKRFQIVVVEPTYERPVEFNGVSYIRVGSYKKKLKDHPEKERMLWIKGQRRNFENAIAKAHVSEEDVLTLIDYERCFKLLNQRVPESRSAIIEKLCQERIIEDNWQGRYDITNLGALLFANQLSTFSDLARKAIRVVSYAKRDRIEAKKERMGTRGYAAGFRGLIRYLVDELPQGEEIHKALRVSRHMYPEIAIREIVANCLIHQDLTMSGSSPIIEIFEDRVEISNPGKPLIDTKRFMDEPPQSRNETLASLMRRLGICEERGSGIDKVVDAIEHHQLPAPEFLVTEKHTKVVLFGMRPFAEMSKDDRIRACYQHACLRYLSAEQMTNASLRQRFSLSEKQYPQISRVISDAISENLVKPADPKQGKKFAKYVPFWA